MTTPLAGITVLDFGQIYQGPYATLLMAKAGANVIKIEPLHGEPLRRRALAAGTGDTTLPMAMLLIMALEKRRPKRPLITNPANGRIGMSQSCISSSSTRCHRCSRSAGS